MGNFNHLPTDIILEIITRLPTESIQECKSVCRSWRNLVSHNNPFFYQMHLSRLLGLDSGKLSFLVRAENQQLHFFEYNDDEMPIMIRRFNLTLPFKSYYKLLGSFNGLAFAYKFQDNTACMICNPVTREYVMLPSIRRDCGEKYLYSSSGFGYLPSTNEYKVVELYRLRRGRSFTVEVAVYTLGSGIGWRNVERLESTFSLSFTGPGVYVNTALHWMDNRGETILVFDLTEEKFRQPLSPPPKPQGGTYYDYTIGELGGDLYYAMKYYLVGGICSDIWLLKDKIDDLDMKGQVENQQLGWSKEFTLGPGERLPLAFTKTGGVLCFGHWHLSVYDPVASTLKNIVDFTAFRQMFPHKNTLVALKELGEEDIKLMELAESKETKSRILQRSS